MTTIPIITTERLRLDAFGDADIGALAAILAEPDVTKTITANASTPEKCRASARHRIGWHNASWGERGYGVWAVRARSDGVMSAGGLLGWCGFAAPDIGEDPEILYGLAPQCWGSGLAQEMVRAAIGWLFAETPHQGVSAVIFGRLNPVSAAIAGKLGMTKRGTMAMNVFLPDLALARDVLEYEIWRLGYGRTRDAEALLVPGAVQGRPDRIAQARGPGGGGAAVLRRRTRAGRVRAVRSRADRAARPRCVPAGRGGALPRLVPSRTRRLAQRAMNA